MAGIKINSGSGTPATINKPGKPSSVRVNPPPPQLSYDYKSYALDGVDDYISIPQTTLNFSLTDPQSYELWIKMNSLVGVEKTLFSMFGTKGTKIYVDNNQYLSFTIRETSVIRILLRAQFSSVPAGLGDPQIVAGIWYHFVITYDGTDANGVNFYADSLLLGKTIQTNNLNVNPTNTANVFLGSQTATGNRSNCEIALCRVFSKVLSQQEITTLYNSGQPLITTSISNKVFEVIPSAIPTDSVNNATGTISGAIFKSADVNSLVRNGNQFFTGDNLYYNTYARAGEGDRDTVSDSPFTDPRHCAAYNWTMGKHNVAWQQRPYLGGNRQSMLMYVDAALGFATPSYPRGVTMAGGKDNHGAPSVIETSNGEALVMRENQHGGPLYLTRTINKSLTNIEQLNVIAGDQAYPAPAKIGSDLVVWSRGTNVWEDTIVRSSDNGNSWTSQMVTVNVADQVVTQRAYFRRIYHPTKFVLLILKRQEDTGLFEQIFYIESDDGITYRNVTGSFSKNVVTNGAVVNTELQANFNVLSGSTDAWLKTAAFVPGTNTLVGFCNKDDVNSYYQYFYWNGSAWSFKDLPLPLYEQTQAAGNFGRIDSWAMYAYTLNHQLIWRIEPRGGYDVIVKYETFDNWDSWNAGTIISASNKKHEQMQQTYNMDAPTLLILANVVEEGTLDNNMFIHKFTP